MSAPRPRKTDEPMPVHVEGRGYGLLHPMESAPRGKGVVQFGAGGPFEAHPLDRMTPITWALFDSWQYEQPLSKADAKEEGVH